MQNPESKQEVNGRAILGVVIRDLTRDQAIATIDQAFAHGERANICFANAQALNVACDNDHFRAALRRFLVLNDGLGTDIASRIKFGKPFTENLNGTDFVPEYLRRTRHNLRIYLVGTTNAIVERAAGTPSPLLPTPHHRRVARWFLLRADKISSKPAVISAHCAPTAY